MADSEFNIDDGPEQSKKTNTAISALNADLEICPFCKEKLEVGGDICQIRQKGADGINAASVQRGDTIVVMAGSKVHSNCRKQYTNPNDINIQLSKKS